jgi:hypothetical protein
MIVCPPELHGGHRGGTPIAGRVRDRLAERVSSGRTVPTVVKQALGPDCDGELSSSVVLLDECIA